MNKKRLLCAMALVVVLAMSMALLVACGGVAPEVKFKLGEEYFGDNFVAIDYKGMETTRLDPFDVLMEAYNNWIKDTGYKRTQYFTFQAHAPAKLITNFTMDVYKIDGDRLYRRMVVIQDSEPFKGNRNDVTRFYYDGKNKDKAMRIVENDKNNIPGNPEDMFKVNNEPKMVEYAGDKNGSVQERLKTYKEHLTTYIWNDEKNWANSKFEKRVYKAEDGTLRFTMIIDCSKSKMDNVHMAARDEFLSSTGAKEGSLEMRENTTIDFVVKEVGEGAEKTYKFVAWRRTEQYQGKAGGVIPIPAEQTSIEVFSYDEADYTITDADIA